LKAFATEPDPSFALVIPVDKQLVTFVNGVTMKAPKYSIVIIKTTKDAGHELQIIVGNGDAAITQTNGTKSTVPADTVIDGKGSVIP